MGSKPIPLHCRLLDDNPILLHLSRLLPPISYSMQRSAPADDSSLLTRAQRERRGVYEKEDGKSAGLGKHYTLAVFRANGLSLEIDFTV
jgi:hypothetical protein